MGPSQKLDKLVEFAKLSQETSCLKKKKKKFFPNLLEVLITSKFLVSTYKTKPIFSMKVSTFESLLKNVKMFMTV